MAEQKRYYWLKLQDGFFNSKRIKKLRKLAGGDTYTIIYLKMQLLAMKTNGILRWTGLEDSFADELALDLDEDPANVEVTMRYLLAYGLAETDDNTNFFLPYAVSNTGSETASTQRVRDYRERQKALHCNTDETQVKRIGNVEIEKEVEKDSTAPPTLEEVKAFANSRNSNIDPLRFYSYYSTGGWKDPKGNPIGNWKQKFIKWENTEPEKKTATAPASTSKNIKASCNKYPPINVDDIWKSLDRI